MSLSFSMICPSASMAVRSLIDLVLSKKIDSLDNFKLQRRSRPKLLPPLTGEGRDRGKFNSDQAPPLSFSPVEGEKRYSRQPAIEVKSTPLLILFI